jgi:hypothetical protein
LWPYRLRFMPISPQPPNGKNQRSFADGVIETNKVTTKQPADDVMATALV